MNWNLYPILPSNKWIEHMPPFIWQPISGPGNPRAPKGTKWSQVFRTLEMGTRKSRSEDAFWLSGATEFSSLPLFSFSHLLPILPGLQAVFELLMLSVTIMTDCPDDTGFSAQVPIPSKRQILSLSLNWDENLMYY